MPNANVLLSLNTLSVPPGVDVVSSSIVALYRFCSPYLHQQKGKRKEIKKKKKWKESDKPSDFI
jgi:hypothetical protein